jgi:hypothetical protein
LDRQIVFPGSIPLDTDLLNVQRNTMVALGYIAQATLGAGPVVDGLLCQPTVPASMGVTVGPGSIAVLTVLDTLAFGTLPADPVSPLVKVGVNLAPTSFPVTAPTASGQAVNYLIQASLSEADATPIVLPYYNAANPSQPYAGPNNSGTAQNTQRLQRVQLEMKPGAPAPAGTQATPPVDNGWVGLYVVTVNYGQTEVDAPAIAVLPAAPFIAFKLPSLTPGFSRQVAFASSASWTVPAGVTRARIRLVGGGGGGGGSTAANSGGGGGAGGYAEGIVNLAPGQVITVTIGGGGGGCGAQATAATGGTTAFGSYLNATGGLGGSSANPNSAGGMGGVGYGGTLNFTGGSGADGHTSTSNFAGGGGDSAFGGGGRGGSGGGVSGQAPGSGGGGSYETAGNGGAGASGLVVVEF